MINATTTSSRGKGNQQANAVQATSPQPHPQMTLNAEFSNQFDANVA